jgi:DNA (cytosine-5)-methyltransferase 1
MNHEDGNAGGQVAVAIQDCRAKKRQNGVGINDDGSAYTVDTTGNQSVGVVDVADPISANEARTFSHAGNNCSKLHNVVADIRRLTPLECERLQGFPDGWTKITYHGKPAADGPRYRAIGNSMAVPVMRWIGKRIDAIFGVRSFRKSRRIS